MRSNFAGYQALICSKLDQKLRFLMGSLEIKHKGAEMQDVRE